MWLDHAEGFGPGRARVHRQPRCQGIWSQRRFLRALPNFATLPLIYSLTVPLALFDVWLTVYQRICFPIYGIGIVCPT